MANLDCQEYLAQASVLMQQGQYEAALTWLDKAEQSDRMEIEVYLNKGICYANLDKVGEAEQQFEKALKVNRKNGIAMFHMGNIYMMTGRKEQGLEMYNNAIGCGYQDPQIFFTLGLYYEESNDIDMALRSYAKAYQADPNRADARIRRIYLQLRQGELKAALQSIDEMILYCPDVFEGYHARFLVLMQMGEVAEAEKTINTAIRMFPNDVGFAIDKVTLLAEQGKAAEAKAYINEIEGRMAFSNADRAELALQKARLASAENDIDGTIEALESARDYSTADGGELDHKAGFLLANCYMAKQQWEKSLEVLRIIKAAQEKSEFSASVLYMEPLVLRQMGKEEEAVKLYEEAIKTLRALSLEAPGQIDFYLYRIFCLRDLNRCEKALELCDYLGQVAGNIAEVHIAKATVLQVMGREEEAKEEQAIATSLGGVTEEIMNRVAEAQPKE